MDYSVPHGFGYGNEQGVVTCGSYLRLFDKSEKQEESGTFVDGCTIDGRLLVWDCGVVWRLKGEISRPSVSYTLPSTSSISLPTHLVPKSNFSPLSLCYSSLDTTLFVGTQTGSIAAWSLSSAASSQRSSSRTPSMWKSRERAMQQAHTGITPPLLLSFCEMLTMYRYGDGLDRN